MSDRQAAQARLTTLLREDTQAIPYLVGYITWQMETEEILRAIDSYLQHDEKLTAMMAAQKLAAEHARLAPGAIPNGSGDALS